MRKWRSGVQANRTLGCHKEDVYLRYCGRLQIVLERLGRTYPADLLLLTPMPFMTNSRFAQTSESLLVVNKTDESIAKCANAQSGLFYVRRSF
jgi:hypothetical protein